MSMSEAAKSGNVFITVTGDKHVIGREHFEKMRDGAVICNSGHFNVELDLETLNSLSTARRMVRDFVEEYSLRDGRKIFVLGEGRLINLAAAEGHPASVMDMSFANQALSLEYIVRHRDGLARDVHRVPVDLDKRVARLKLESMGIKIDKLTPEQEKYLSSWQEGT
jgi:adenosylhomocysteinase